MKWDWIFFDADETLFTFDSFTGLQRSLYRRWKIQYFLNRRRLTGIAGNHLYR
jgi:FMN phosphatase YigB (HAD superfamily)